MTYFICQSEFTISKDTLFSFHEGSDGFRVLVSLAKGIEVIQAPNSLAIGSTAIMKVPILPFIKMKWIAEHTGYVKNDSFTDTQISGPFNRFIHQHKFRSLNQDRSVLIDQIEILFWFWPITRFFILPILKKQFQTRHKATAEFLGCEYKLMFCGYSSSVVD